MFFNVEINGLDKLKGALDRKVLEMQEEIGLELQASARNIHDEAINRMPVDMGVMKGATFVFGEGSEWGVEVRKFYAPYVEFGTGQNAAAYLSSKDEELKKYAMTFYKTGKGRMTPQPFLFPALDNEIPKLIERVQNILDEK